MNLPGVSRALTVANGSRNVREIKSTNPAETNNSGNCSYYRIANYHN